jgi:hypothetical protein
VAQVDRAIDEAVYALYGLTDAEQRLVEPMVSVKGQLSGLSGRHRVRTRAP